MQGKFSPFSKSFCEQGLGHNCYIDNCYTEDYFAQSSDVAPCHCYHL